MWRAMTSNWLARGLMLLGLVMLIAAPVAPATAAPMDCCPDAPCHDIDKSACPQACVVACQLIVAPDLRISPPLRRDAPPVTPEIALLPLGQAVAPDLPPPR